MKARSLEWRKNCFSRGTFDLPHQRVLNFDVGLEWRSGARTKRFHELDSASGCRKVREFERKREKRDLRRWKKGREAKELTTAWGGNLILQPR